MKITCLQCGYPGNLKVSVALLLLLVIYLFSGCESQDRSNPQKPLIDKTQLAIESDTVQYFKSRGYVVVVDVLGETSGEFASFMIKTRYVSEISDGKKHDDFGTVVTGFYGRTMGNMLYSDSVGEIFFSFETTYPDGRVETW